MKSKQPISDNDKSGDQSNKRWIIAGVSFLLFIIFLISLFYIAENRAEQKILDLVNSELSPNSEMLIDDFSLTILPLGITIKRMTLLKHQSIVEFTPQKPADAIRELTIEEITLSGIKLISLLRRDHIQLKRVFLHGVNLEAVHLDSISRADSTMNSDPLPISVSQIQFSGLNLKLYDTPVSDSSSTEIQNLSGEITNYILSDPSQFNTSEFEELEISVDHFSHFTENGFYEASLDSIRLNTIYDQLTFNHFHLRPLMNAYEMALDIGYPVDNYDFRIPYFKIEQMDLSRWFSDKEFIAGKITLTEPDITISRDKSLPRREREDRILPTLQFKNLPFSVDIDTIFAENGTLHYNEQIAAENRAGSISFSEIDLSLYSMVNRSTDPILAEATALFMNQSEFDLNIEFSLDKNSSHTVSGNLYQFDLTSMNSTFENLVLIHLNSGKIQQLNFQFDANDDQAFGNLMIIYSDLDVQFIDTEQQTERGWNRVRSFIANTFVIQSDNSAEDPRPGEIEFDRDKERSIFNYWVKSISTGLIDTIKR